MQHNIYFSKVNSVFIQAVLQPSQNSMPSNPKPEALELQHLLKQFPLRLDLVQLQLDVLSLEYLDNIDDLLKELIFLFSYSNLNKHKWFINPQGNSIHGVLEFLYYLETTLFDILIELQENKLFKKYQKIVQGYLPNTYYTYYLKALSAQVEGDLKLAYFYLKKAHKQRGNQENILIQMQEVCKKLDKTKEYKKYTAHYERLVL